MRPWETLFSFFVVWGCPVVSQGASSGKRNALLLRSEILMILGAAALTIWGGAGATATGGSPGTTFGVNIPCACEYYV